MLSVYNYSYLRKNFDALFYVNEVIKYDWTAQKTMVYWLEWLLEKAKGPMLYPISFTPKVVVKNSEPAYHLLLASGSHASYANGINKQMLGHK